MKTNKVETNKMVCRSAKVIDNRVIIDLDCKPYLNKENTDIISMVSLISDLHLIATNTITEKITPQIIALALMNAKIDNNNN